ncbi:hypothetical protein BBJ29_005244 [Phytophthora kernoviae]|uniref:Uncharacterized protein n=1 Tax=Phytophthora kernoviae TaxID=325452 RepID=A0A3F2RVY8_9STRA|nr:hypothetical protein BBP00_00003473 [Phytophthora kernoviae]RLN69053.1 hypothetical protein BBJ29_005244 [Phytophthora kernoviae]
MAVCGGLGGGGELHSEVETKLSMQRSPFQAEWRDVTQLMSAAAKELKVGQLVHEEDFKLFDSMSALELMDPKMDSGMLVNGMPPLSIAARLEGSQVPLEFSSARDVLATLDELFRCSPPRDIKVPTIDEALDQMKKVLEEMVVACSPAEWTCMEDLRTFLVEFSRQQPAIVARSYVLLFLYADKKIYAKYNFMDWLSAAMVLNGVPSVLLSTQEGVLYSSRSIETVYESLKLYLHNRSRQRARIEYLLDEWSVLQVEATAVDEKFTTEMNIPKAAYPRYFTAWSLEESVQLMIQYVALGLELDLYAPSEFGTIYWYLDYLQGSRLQNLNVTWTFVEKMKQIMPPTHRNGPESTNGSKGEASGTPQPETSSKVSKKSKAKHKKHKNGAAASAMSETPEVAREPVDPTKARFLREIQYTEMLRSLMRAYFQLSSALEREGLVQVNPPMYSTFTIRFQRRFSSLQKMHYPAALTYEDFCQNSDFSPYELELIYKSAEECFKVARTHAEALLTDEDGINTMLAHDGEAGRVRGVEIEALLKVAISNCVRLAQRTGTSNSKTKKTSTSPSKDKKVQMEFDFSIHPHFPVVVFPLP